MKPSTYDVLWTWRSEQWPYVDIVKATDAQRAINKVKKALKEEYADVGRMFVPLEVIRHD